MKLDTNSLAHTKWECKYHIVFAPKYRRQIIYGKIKADIGQMLRKLCEYKGLVIDIATVAEGVESADGGGVGSGDGQDVAPGIVGVFYPRVACRIYDAYYITL